MNILTSRCILFIGVTGTGLPLGYIGGRMCMRCLGPDSRTLAPPHVRSWQRACQSNVWRWRASQRTLAPSLAATRTCTRRRRACPLGTRRALLTVRKVSRCLQVTAAYCHKVKPQLSSQLLWGASGLGWLCECSWAHRVMAQRLAACRCCSHRHHDARNRNNNEAGRLLPL